MPGGILEERLRGYVKRRLDTRRSTAARLARHLVKCGLRKNEKEATTFVSLYKSGERDADLDTAVEIARFFKQPLPALMGDRPLVDLDLETTVDQDVVVFKSLSSDDKRIVRRVMTGLRRQAQR